VEVCSKLSLHGSRVSEEAEEVGEGDVGGKGRERQVSEARSAPLESDPVLAPRKRKRKRRKKMKKEKEKEEGVGGEAGLTVTLAHWNARGLSAKAPVLKQKMAKMGVQLCGVSEAHTYRDTHLSDGKYAWDPGVENRPKSTQPHPPGGIGMVASREVKYGIVGSGKYSVWARMELEGGAPVFVGECYFPHSAKTRLHREAWKEVVERVREYSEVGHVVLMGDFNAHAGLNGGSSDATGRMLLSRSKELGLVVLNGTDVCVGKHTRVMERSDGSATATTIDYIMVSKSLMPHVGCMQVVADRMGSDHCMLTLQLVGLCAAPCAAAELREVWRMENIPHYKDAAHSEMVRAFQEAFRGWSTSVSSMVAALESGDGGLAAELEESFQVQLDEVAEQEIGTKFVGPCGTGMLTAKVRRLNTIRAERDAELRCLLADPYSTIQAKAASVEAYRRAKADAQRAVRERRDAIELKMFEQIEAAQSNSKLLWSCVSKIAGPLTDSVKPPPLAMDAGGKVHTEPLEVLKVWRDFCTSIANPGDEEECIYDEDHRHETEERLEQLRSVRLRQPHLDRPITPEEVFAAIRKLKSGKAPGVDGVTTTILKMAAGAVGKSALKPDNPVVGALVLLFNYVFEHEVWPARWATGIIFPLYKEGSRLLPGNYRPITLLSVVGKLFGSVVESRLSEWAEGEHALADEQGGFRRCRGTPDLIFLLREIILTRKSRGQATLATFIDAKKAYDTVWREGNYVRLWDLGVRGKLWRQVQAMSSDPKSKVRLPFGETEYFRVSRGVAQGAVESPFLYACFINALADELKQKGLGIVVAGRRVPLLMYADDVVFLAGNVSELLLMNDCVTAYARRNRYQLNGKKSAVMAFNADDATKRDVASESWKLSGERVEVTRRYKYLGVDVLENVKDWKAHFARTTAKAKRVTEDLEWACRRSGGLRPRAAAALWKAIVRPVLEYAAEIWAGDIGAREARAAEKVQTDFARSMLGLVGCQSVSNDALRAEMGMEKLELRWAKLQLGYWRRIHVASPERALVAVADLRRKHLLWALPGAADGWMRGARDLLVGHGLGHYWHNPTACTAISKDEWKDVVYEAVEGREDVVLAARFAQMRGTAAARYARIKLWSKFPAELSSMKGEAGRRGAQVPERYLDSRAEPVGTRLKLMCRLGCLPTMVRVAREEKLPPEMGLCKLCGQGMEDARHLLLSCSAHANQRARMVGGVDRGLEMADTAPLSEQSEVDQLDLLLGKTTGLLEADDRISRCVARFLKKAWRSRKWLTASLNAKLGRSDTIWALKAHGDREGRLGVPASRARVAPT